MNVLQEGRRMDRGNTAAIWQQAGSGQLSAEIASAAPDTQKRILEGVATEIRLSVLGMIAAARMGHVGGDFSVADILTTLYLGVLKCDPANPAWRERDRFILSKGHCAASLYSVLAMRGFIPRDLLKDFMAPLSPLNGHPNRLKVAGVEASTGPLGHGLPIAVGCAVSARITGAPWRTFVVTGDGELQEGSNWEAAMAAAHRGLSNLTLIIDRNGLQQGATTEFDKSARSACRQMDRLRLGRVRGRRTRSLRAAERAQCARDSAATLRHRPHAQGPGSFVHGRSRRVASQGSVRRADHGRDCGAFAMNHVQTAQPRFDCRIAFAEELVTLARDDERIVAVCNDSVGSSNLGAFQKEFESRLVNVGIAEQNMVGVAAGLSNGGHVPFVCAASPFLPAGPSSRSRRTLHIAGATSCYADEPGGLPTARSGPIHHSTADLPAGCGPSAASPLRSPPTVQATREAVRWALGADRPVFLRISRHAVPSVTPEGWDSTRSSH